jgi:hypothetical protein
MNTLVDWKRLLGLGVLVAIGMTIYGKTPPSTSSPASPASAASVPSVPVPSNITDPLHANSLPKIVDTYRQNEARFKRDFMGQQFEAVLPFNSAKESFFSRDKYLVGFGSGGFSSEVDCFVSDKAIMSRIVDWNKGDSVKVSGVIKDVTMGSVQLATCVFEPN